MLRFLFRMAIQAPAHIHPQRRSGFFHRAYIAMAAFTINSGPKVRLVTEINKVWLIIYGDPGNWLAPFPVARELLHRFIFGGDYHVATNTSFYGRYASDRRPSRLPMAIKALYTSLDMSLVAVIDRLLRRSHETCSGKQNGKEYNDCYDQ